MATALTAEPCRARIVTALLHIELSRAVSGSYNRPEGADSADMPAKCRNRSLSSARPSRTGVKDIIETKGLATELGSPVYNGRIGATDAAIVQDLRKRGGILLGKTQCTSFAYKTESTDPSDGDPSTGGTSAGSNGIGKCHTRIGEVLWGKAA